MKKYLFLFIAMLMSVSAFTLVGCSSDDDDEQDGSGNNNGKVSVKYEGATTENYSVQQATFELFSQSVEGSTHYDYDNGATFNVTFTDGDNYYTYWQFQSRENIKAGQKLAVSAIFLFQFQYGTIKTANQEATWHNQFHFNSKLVQLKHVMVNM